MAGLVGLVLLVFGVGFLSTEANTDAFHKICNDLFVHIISSDSITLNYNLANPEKYSIYDYAPTLGDLSPGAAAPENAFYENIVTALSMIDKDSLSGDDRFTYDILTDTFSLYNKMSRYAYYNEPFSPVSGIQAQLPVLLCEYHFYTIDDVDDYLALLECVPDYFRQLIEYEKERKKKGFGMSVAQTDVIIRQCLDFINKPAHNILIETFAGRLAAIDGYDGARDDELINKNRALVLNCIIPSYSYLINELDSLKDSSYKTVSVCSVTDEGKDYYALLLRMTTGSGKTPAEAYALVNDWLESCKKGTAECLTTTFSSGEITANEKSDINNALFIPDKKTKNQDPAEILTCLKAAISSDFPALPSDTDIDIKYVHPSLENTLSPAMYMSPPIDISSDDCIYINRALCDDDSIFTTLAHEGYPGHLYQTRYFMSTDPAPIRQVLNFGGYIEGWATYVELLSCDYMGMERSYCEAAKCNKLAILCIYSLIDIGIHYYGWTETDCIKLLYENGIRDPEAGKEMYLTVVSEPALYTKYTLGCLEFLELRKIAEERYGGSFSLSDFHEKILKCGPCPFYILSSIFENVSKF